MFISMKKIYIVLTVFCLSAVFTEAQFVADYLKAGDGYFAKADYASAADYYEKYLGNAPVNKAGDAYSPYKPQLTAVKKEIAMSSREKAQWQLAESYRLLHYTTKAEEGYRKLLEANKGQFPLAAFHLGGQLRALGKYEDAEAMFSSFLHEYTTADVYRTTAEREVKNLQFIRKELHKPGLQYYTVTPAEGILSSAGANYAPVWIDSTTLLFTSTRTEGSNVEHARNELYEVQLGTAVGGAIKSPGLAKIKGKEQGVATVSANGSTLYFTRWNATGKKQAMLYVCTKTSDQWSEPKLLSSLINQPGSSTQQPFLTRDGRYLLFASDRAGGEGGFDIWYAPINESGEIGVPVNAGVQINTADDEQAPYYDEVTHTLVFASNGRIGMGGFDLFTSKGRPGAFAAPENMGYPVNSVKDDIYFASRTAGEDLLSEVWLSSDRTAACCLELFRLTRKLPPPPAPAPVTEPVVVVAPPAPDTMRSEVLENVYFAYDKAILLEGSESSLNKLVMMLKENPGMVIELAGHTDNKGNDAYNQKLSLARAQKCVDYIVSKGIDASRIIARGYGATQPIAPNNHPDGSDNPEGRKQNRRTEFTILKK